METKSAKLSYWTEPKVKKFLQREAKKRKSSINALIDSAVKKVYKV